MKIAIPTGAGKYRFLTNKKLKVGDKVFPLAHTYRNKGKVYITGLSSTGGYWRNPDTMLACTGWPSKPHTVTGFYRYEGVKCLRTDMGHGPAIAYFKEMEGQ